MANQPRVYIPNSGCHDFSGAERFGTLTPLTQGKYNLLSVGRMYRVFEEGLAASQPDDFILIAGPAVMSSILCSLFSVRHGKLNLLLYHMGQDGVGRYKQRNIIFR